MNADGVDGPLTDFSFRVVGELSQIPYHVPKQHSEQRFSLAKLGSFAVQQNYQFR
ncbi:hypothetical protein [Ralstonia solanacearum]|uniref:hypothetical protein n=1 Tax=Ralstonia solanacearum TaxID=305 RepID=UPI000A65EBC2|nr:hypothetical protein [Ralstonia solanacearum]